MKNATHTVRTVYVECSALVADHKSGVSRVLQQTLSAWSRSVDGEFNVKLLVPFDRKNIVEALGLRFKIVAIPVPYKIFRLFRKYDLFPPMDLFLGRGTYIFPDFWNWRLARSKAFTYVHDVNFLNDPQSASRKNSTFLNRYLARWLKRSYKVLAVSEFTRKEVVRLVGIDKSKIIVVPNGVESSIPIPGEKSIIEGNYLLFVGNMEPRKNIPALIRAYALLPKSLSANYKLVLVGSDGWNSESIHKAIQGAQSAGLNVIHMGSVDDAQLNTLYEHATALVHPASYEGFGMTPLEAMRHGTPVIVANNSSLPEVVGDAGLYVDESNPQDISDKIEALLNNKPLRNNLKKKGLERAKALNWARSLKTLHEALKQ